jgi:uncharacterized protein (DUF58 family)
LLRIQVSGLLRARFARWLDARVPATSSVTLSRRNIFIFPTANGFAFGGLILLILLGGVNYQSSLVLGVAFLLGSVFVLAIIGTFQQLSGLSLALEGPTRIFAGDRVEFRLHLLQADPHDRVRVVSACWPSTPRIWLPRSTAEVAVISPADISRRGWYRPPRLAVESVYPLGLLRAWALPAFNVPVLVWPAPDFAVPPNYGAAGDMSEPSRNRQPKPPDEPADSNDFRIFRAGDRPRAVLWRAWARGGPMLVRSVEETSDPVVSISDLLDLDQVSGDLEQRLSRLAGQALLLHRSGTPFGLRLGEQVVPHGTGEDQLRRILDALASFSPVGRGGQGITAGG